VIIAIALSCSSTLPENKKMNYSPEEQSEQAVIIHLKLADGNFGDPQEREAIIALGDKLNQIIKKKRVGEYDGHEFGEGFATLYMYGPDATKLFDAIIETVKEHPSRSGSHIIKRFGSPGAKEERRDL
jgi:hypothetical protein